MLGSLAISSFISILILNLSKTLDFCFNVQKTNWTVIFKRYQRMKVTVSIIETFVIQLWSLLLMLKIFERSLIKKLNLIPLNLLGASFDACYRLYCQMYGVYKKFLDVLPAQLPLCSFASDEKFIHWQRNSKEQGKKQKNKENDQGNGHAGSSVWSLNPDHFLSCVRPDTSVW